MPSGQRSPLELYEFFAGAGGFSTGAAQAGCKVVYVCDNSASALETHKRNHPGTEHQCAELPNDDAAAKLPTDGRRYHVHCSPPCVRMSKMNAVNVQMGNKGVSGRQGAVNLIEWSLEMMLASQCTSWSLEQVGEREVVQVVERLSKKHPGRIGYAIIDFSELGVPQTRVRLIAASPRLLACLLRKRSAARRQSVRQAIPEPRGTHVRQGQTHKRLGLRTSRKHGQTMYHYRKATWSDNCRPISRPAHTVRGGHSHVWVTIEKGKVLRHDVMHANEMAALQTFPPNYKLPKRKNDACVQVGNAVPPLVAKLLLEDEARVV